MRTTMRTLLVVAFALAFCVGNAQATFLSIQSDPGTYGLIPAGTTKNDLVDDVYGPGVISRNGYYGSTIQLTATAPASVTFYYLGEEAGYNNKFNVSGTTQFTNNTSAVGSYVTLSLGSGTLPFSFLPNGSSGSAIANGSNPDGSNPSGWSLPNFFVSFDGDPLAKSGNSLVVWFDDGGAGSDDNHDDMVIRIVATPEPGSIILFITGLFGLAGYRIGRRRRS